jgi:hypothetical protein
VHATISFAENRCALANYSIATVFTTPKLTGLQHPGRIAWEGQCYGSPKKMEFLEQTI